MSRGGQCGAGGHLTMSVGKDAERWKENGM